MRLVTRVNGALILLVCGFALSGGLFVHTATTAANVQQVLDSTRVVLRESNALAHETTRLLTTSRRLSSAMESFTEARSRAELAMDHFRDTPELEHLSPEVRNEIESMVETWDTTTAQTLDRVETGVSEIRELARRVRPSRA